MTTEPIESLLENALAFRTTLFAERHETAFRLFNGFTEGAPDLVADLYAKTLLNLFDQPDRAVGTAPAYAGGCFICH